MFVEIQCNIELTRASTVFSDIYGEREPTNDGRNFKDGGLFGIIQIY